MEPEMRGKMGLPQGARWVNNMFADGHTASNAPDLFRPPKEVSEVKQRRARLVLGWGTAREDLRGLPAFGTRSACVGACCGRAWASCCGRAFASCWACRLCVWKLQQCCCSVLLFKTHWKEVPAIAVCFGSQGLAEVDQTWTQRGPNVDPNETKSRKKLLFYFFVVSPSLSLSLSLSRGSILATVGSDSCTFPTKRRPT